MVVVWTLREIPGWNRFCKKPYLLSFGALRVPLGDSLRVPVKGSSREIPRKEMTFLRVEAGSTSFNAAISACEKRLEVGFGFRVLQGWATIKV